jgi:cell division septation protein DedD
MMKERTVDLVERLSRQLVGQIPNPPPPPVSPTVIEIQVASFLDRSRAEKSLKNIQAQGLNPLIKDVKMGNNLWHRIILGPFYNRDEAEMIKERVMHGTKFKPIIIPQYPDREDDGTTKESP